MLHHQRHHVSAYATTKKSDGRKKHKLHPTHKLSHIITTSPIVKPFSTSSCNHSTDSINNSNDHSITPDPLSSHSAHAITSDNVTILPIKVLNSLSGQVEPLRIRHRMDIFPQSYISPHLHPGFTNVLTWYVCGPTVYDHSHIGHARTYTCFDLMRRTVRDYFNIPLLFAMGVTDIDDKIINKSKESGKHWLELARHFENDFNQDLAHLNILPPDMSLRVSEFIPDILSYIQQLDHCGLTYSTQSGIYFNVQKFIEKGYLYGKLRYASLHDAAQYVQNAILSKDTSIFDEEQVPKKSFDHNDSIQTPAFDQIGVPVVGADEKKHPADFCLWKFQKDPAYEPAFASDKYGLGRPGWHIECSAMTASAVGVNIDIHSGGVDLRFPHHCNEIAQAEGCLSWGAGDFDKFSQKNVKTVDFSSESSWTATWIHTGHLHIKGLKMSKSLKNFITIKNLLGLDGETSESYSADDFRLLCMTTPYNSTLDYNPTRLAQCRADLKNIREFYTYIQRTIVQMDFIKNHYNETQNSIKSDMNEKTSQLTANINQIKPNIINNVDCIDNCNFEDQLLTSFLASQNAVHTALSCNFNFPTVVSQLSCIMSQTTKYIDLIHQYNNSTTDLGSKIAPNVLLLTNISQYINKIYKTLGFEFAGGGLPQKQWKNLIAVSPSTLSSDDYNTPKDGSSHKIESDAEGVPLYLHDIAQNRVKLKKIAMENIKITKQLNNILKNPIPSANSDHVVLDKAVVDSLLSILNENKTIMNVCDSIRDEVFAKVGYNLKDTSGAGATDRNIPAMSYYISKL